MADRIVAGSFEMLGSGTVHLGRTPAWRQDLYTGRVWPLAWSSRIPIHLGDGSDIRTVWELSRFYHVVPLARAYWKTGCAHYATAYAEHVTSWIAQNPIGRGPHWKSAMDVALRACNWALGATCFGASPDVPASVTRAQIAGLLAAGRFVERNLEWHPRFRGNHYVANLLGLLYLGAMFRDRPYGDRWYTFAHREMEREIRHQVHTDGVSFEGALGYHRLALEMFARAAQIVDRNGSPPLSLEYRDRLGRMYGFLRAYLPPSGEAPMVGDGDDGRVHWTWARTAREPRRHGQGLPTPVALSSEASSSEWPHGGFFVLRSSSAHGVIRCGRVGLKGAGSHDHNDQLGFELWLRGVRIVADSGTYCYTRNLTARHAFRRTAAHSVVQLGDEEQNPIRQDRPWRILEDRTQSRPTRWQVDPDATLFEGEHYGYRHRHSRAVVRRRVLLKGQVWSVVDTIDGLGEESVTWRLHLGEGNVRMVQADDSSFVAVHDSGTGSWISVEHPPSLGRAITVSDASDAYGVRYERPCLVLSGAVALPMSIRMVIQ